ncbi:MAG: ATP-binding protein [Alicyclobacillus sp.]|nr:ATP-binding protein [Alicyclobacillus sp.]
MNSSAAFSGADICPHCGGHMHRITTVLIKGKEIPFGPYVCECSEFVAAQAQRDAERKAQREAEERHREQERIERLFQTSGLPARWRHRTFDGFQRTDANRDAFDRAKQYADGFDATEGRGLLFTGSVGTGKTHLAAAITMQLISRGHWVVFGTITSLLNDIRHTYDDDARESMADVLRRLKRCELLVIDDLGKERVTDWVEEVVFEVINARYDDNKALVVTTNLPLRAVRENYPRVGEALVDRILEMCQGVRMMGESWRRRA